MTFYNWFNILPPTVLLLIKKVKESNQKKKKEKKKGKRIFFPFECLPFLSIFPVEIQKIKIKILSLFPNLKKKNNKRLTGIFIFCDVFFFFVDENSMDFLSQKKYYMDFGL